jgi:hypothetical protein
MAAAPPAPGAGKTAEEIQACVRANQPARSARQELAFETERPAGKSELAAELFWQRTPNDLSQLLVRVEAPPDVRGSAFLLIERKGGNDMFSYLPELGKVRRITGHSASGSLFGTDFSYEDMQELQSVASHASAERLPDAQVEGRPVWVIGATSAPESGSAYQRVVSYVDQESCVVLEIELFAGPDRLAKKLTVPWPAVRKDGSRWVADRATLRDLEKESQTTLLVRKASYDVDIPRKFFSEAELAKGH